MSIFGGKSNSTANTVVPTFEGYSCEYNGDLQAVSEGYEDLLAVIESIHELEMAELSFKKDMKTLTEAAAIEARTTEYETVTENAAKNVWEKIKQFFVKMWGKLKQFFATVVRFFDGLVKSGKDFVTKYEKELRRLNLEGYTFKMFKYSNLEGGKADNFMSVADGIVSKLVQRPSTQTADEFDKVLDKIDSSKEDTLNSIRGAFVSGGNMDREEYSEALFGHFRSGAKDAEDKEEVKINISDIIATLKDEKPLKAAQDGAKDCDKVFEKAIKSVNDTQKAYDKLIDDKNADDSERGINNKIVALMQKQASLFSEAKTIALEYFRAWKDAVVERNTAYKAVATNAFHYKKKD